MFLLTLDLGTQMNECKQTIYSRILLTKSLHLFRDRSKIFNTDLASSTESATALRSCPPTFGKRNSFTGTSNILTHTNQSQAHKTGGSSAGQNQTQFPDGSRSRKQIHPGNCSRGAKTPRPATQLQLSTSTESAIRSPVIKVLPSFHFLPPESIHGDDGDRQPPERPHKHDLHLTNFTRI